MFLITLISRQLGLLLNSDNLAVYSGPRFAEPLYQLSLVVDRFSGRPGQDFTCDLIWTILDLQTRKIIRRERFTLTVPIPGNSYQDYVAAASTAIGQFSSTVLAPAFAKLASPRQPAFSQ